jgi:hypothetical protein
VQAMYYSQWHSSDWMDTWCYIRHGLASQIDEAKEKIQMISAKKKFSSLKPLLS